VDDSNARLVVVRGSATAGTILDADAAYDVVRGCLACDHREARLIGENAGGCNMLPVANVFQRASDAGR
jgi:hypothetical protein